MPRFQDCMRWGSLIRGQGVGAAERRRQAGKNSAWRFYFTGGMQVLTDALAAAVGPVLLQSRATRIERGADSLFTLWTEAQGRTLALCARSLVLATPADQAALLLRDHAGDAAAALSAIDYAPVASVASAYARWRHRAPTRRLQLPGAAQGAAQHPGRAVLQQHVRGPRATRPGSADHLRRLAR